MNDRIELLRQTCLEIMTPALRFRPVNHTDGALEPPGPEQLGRIVSFAEIEPEARDTDVVEKFFVTAGERRTDAFALGNATPVRRCSYRPRICAEPNRKNFASVALAGQLAHIPFAALAHLGRARIAEM